MTMGIFRRIVNGLRIAAQNRDASDEFWYGPAGTISAAGVHVTPSRALQVPAVWDCLQVISRTLAALPLGLFRRRSDGGREPVRDHPLWSVLHDRPNERQSAAEFRGQMQFDLGLHNNAYALILPGPRGAVDQLIRIDPEAVTPRRLARDTIVYDVRTADGEIRRYREDQIWHLRGLPLSDDGITAVSQIAAHRETIGQALALQDYAARFFRNDSRPPGIIKHPGRFQSDEHREKFKRSWQAAQTGVNRHKIAVLEYGMEWQSTAVTNEQAQFLETRKQLAVEIAAIWQVPPHKIGILDRATFSNIEQQALEFVIDTMLPWLVLWEQAIGRDLIVGDGDLFAEFNVLGLLRGDAKSRFEAYAIGRNWGWLSVNDIRRLENMNPIEDGDTYLQPLNMVPIGDESSQTRMGRAHDRPAPASNTAKSRGNGHADANAS